jgi:hypothetical protein
MDLAHLSGMQVLSQTQAVVASKPMTLGFFDCAALLLGFGLMGIAALWPAARRQG